MTLLLHQATAETLETTASLTVQLSLSKYHPLIWVRIQWKTVCEHVIKDNSNTYRENEGQIKIEEVTWMLTALTDKRL